MTAASAFPPLPAFGAHVRTVYWEPVLGSGERLGVLVAARADDHWHVQPVIPVATWTCFLGRQAETATRLIGLVAESLQHHLDNGGRLETWQTPVSGVIAGETQYLLGHDINHVIRSAVRDTCAFAVLPDDLAFDDQAVADEVEPESDRWPVLIKNAVVQQRARLSRYFNRDVTVRDGARATRLDYAGERYCANFAKVVPDIRLGRSLGAAKIKLLDLEQVRSHTRRGDIAMLGGGDAPDFELLIYRPSEDDPAYSERAMANLGRALIQLEDFADTHEMRMIVTPTASAAAARLLQYEAA